MSNETYSIQEASIRVNVSKHTLRFWEKELKGIIVPLRTGGRQRRYTLHNLYIIEEIKRLREKGLSIPDIRRILDNTKDRSPQNNNLEKIDMLTKQIAEVVRSTLYNILEEGNIHKRTD